MKKYPMRNFRIRITLLALLLPTASSALAADVVIYGATAGGTVAAIAAAKEGVEVLLLEPGNHVGGMVSGGLGRTDMDRQKHLIGGFSREFFARMGQRYERDFAWTFEPHVAESVLRDWLKDAGVTVLFGHRLDRVFKEGNRILKIRMENGAEFEATVFVDASYEGDVMAGADVSYFVGREGRDTYKESLAGRREIFPGHHQFTVPVSPFDSEGKLLPYIQMEEDIVPTGAADQKIQAYCFRICLTEVPENRLPIPKPEDYDSRRYGLVKNHILARNGNVSIHTFLGIAEMPNGKTDINSGCPVSTNLLGGSWEYPEASYARRQEIWDEHLSWVHGLLYFLGHDPVVPEKVRDEMLRWGLAKDEFVDTGHWPHQLYVREARRMLGEHILTQHDLQTRRTKYDSIGMGGYNVDIREVQWVAFNVFRFPEVRREVLMEGYVSMPVEPYEIPYRALLPRQDECDNLLVTSCISASQIAYASFRMEPQYMIVGHAAGVAAAQAIRTAKPVHRIDLTKLQQRLEEQEQILHFARAE